MRPLTPLSSIAVPSPKPDLDFQGRLFDVEVRYRGLKALLGAADHDKAGERNAGLAAKSQGEREAARALLADVTLQTLFDHPLTDLRGEVDSVMRVNYDVDKAAFQRIARFTVGELKDHLLRSDGRAISAIGRALTGPMAAAVAKLCDVHELVLLSRRITRPTKARTLLGGRGTLSSRLQPNHPTDDPRGIALLCYVGLSMGAGDAIVGVNPAVDTVDNVASILRLLDRIRRETGAPTQICVLGHVRTQLACLDKGAPVEILFQSLAGTERTNVTEFDITVDLLDDAYRTMAERGALAGEAEQFTYFETGQGSEYTYGKHEGIDMTTTEALCYGLARRWDPFMVNNVTGFIGPETHRDDREMILSNLQDCFMGKLLGLPMGMAPCFTLHADITLEGQQMATELLTAAGANYYMDVHLNTDRMLAYFDTSGHDVETLREVFGKEPGAAMTAWGIGKGIFVRDEDGALARGPSWGDPSRFVPEGADLRDLMASTPALYGFDHAGPRPTEAVARTVRRHHAVARRAITVPLDVASLRAITEVREVTTRAATKEEHLGSPALGAELSEASLKALSPERTQVQILLSDGLSAEAVHHNARELIPVLLDGLRANDVTMGTPIAARHGRVKLAEPIAERLQTDLVIHLIGERPGGDAQSAKSLSAYLVYRLADPEVQKLAAAASDNPEARFECSVVSNIHDGGLPPIEAASVIVELALAILKKRAAGNRLASMSGVINRG